VRDPLVVPLSEVFRNTERAGGDRSWATNFLAEYAAPEWLADLLLDADARQFPILWSKAKDQREQVVATCEETLGTALEKQQTEADKERLARRQANAGVALLRLGQAEKVWPLLRYRPPDPRVRSYLIHRLGPLGAETLALVKQLDVEEDVSVQRALLLSLGEFEIQLDLFRFDPRYADPGLVSPQTLFSHGALDELLPRVWQLYREHPDPGLHAAAEWLLRKFDPPEGMIAPLALATMREPLVGADHDARWDALAAETARKQLVELLMGKLAKAKLKEAEQQWAKDEHFRHDKLAAIRQELAKDPDKARPQWYVNGQGQTMVVIPGPVEFLMGSPATEADRENGPEGKEETQHRQRIGRTFALAAKEVTVEQFRPFRPEHVSNKKFAPTDDRPVTAVQWYEAAAYCNWLSQQEGIAEDQWCYLPNKDGKFAAGMRTRPGYLSLAGYRLPTEAEWEFACRAGALTSRFYGETEDLLGEYAWYFRNSQQRLLAPVGSLKPNDLGLFDMLGNATEWCHERITTYPQGGGVSEEFEDVEPVADPQPRLLRGGSFFYQAAVVRSAYRDRNLPPVRLNDAGFRPARTFR
jgi:formylglycine-generating enzyme required for sulfatase activity